LRARNITERDWQEIEDGIARSPGTHDHGTAATMMSITRRSPCAARCIVHSGAGLEPRQDGHPVRQARRRDGVGRLKPRDFAPDLDNAIVTLMAMGGSTNALIHLVAMAGRAGIKLPLERYNEYSAKTPLLANVRPLGRSLPDEDFYYAAPARASFGAERPAASRLPHRNGKTLGENLEGARIHNEDVIRKRDNPLKEAGGLVVVRGKLAPNGAVIKAAAATGEALKQSQGGRVRGYNDMAARIDRDDLEVDATRCSSCATPVRWRPGRCRMGHAARAEEAAEASVSDMVRISDARMSGTSYRTGRTSPRVLRRRRGAREDRRPDRAHVERRELNLKVDAAQLARAESRDGAKPSASSPALRRDLLAPHPQADEGATSTSSKARAHPRAESLGRWSSRQCF